MNDDDNTVAPRVTAVSDGLAMVLERLKKLPVMSEEELAAIKAEEKAERVLRLRQDWNVPLRQRLWLRENRVVPPGVWRNTRDQVRAAVTREGGALVLITGPPDRGRTTLAADALEWVTAREWTGLYQGAGEMAVALSDAIRQGGLGAQIDAWLEPWLLVIDDLGDFEVTGDLERRRLGSLLLRRDEACRSTLVVSQMSGEELVEWMGEDRLEAVLRRGFKVRCHALLPERKDR